MTVPIDMPRGASSADLTIEGIDYHREYTGITENEFVFNLPEPPQEMTKEDAYELTLKFNNGVSRHARLGMIRSKRPDADGMTTCLAPEASIIWGIGIMKFSGLVKAGDCLLIVE